VTQPLPIALAAPAAAPAASPDEEALQALLSAHRATALRLAYRLCGGDAAAAEDVAQEALLAAWRALPQFRGEAGLSTWLHTILVREARRHHRRQPLRRLWPFGAVPEPIHTPPLPDAPLRARIHAALSALSVGQREAFVLVHLEGLTVPQAAAVAGRAEGTLKSHLHRAVTRLRVELADLAPGAPTEAP
jgi:RNA polymerase sigma-70 factor (ECF subfamily)